MSNNYWKTHDVTNQFSELENYNLFLTDKVIQEYIDKYQLSWANDILIKIGEDLGKSQTYQKAANANNYIPVLKTFDNRGNRKDFVEFHNDWHWFMQYAKQTGMIDFPFSSEQKGRWIFSSSIFMIMAQIEAGSMCPTTMTQASIALLKHEPQLWKELKDKLNSREYDQRDIPYFQKKSIWIGMGMTEKQGGSDVRTNTTIATPVSQSGRGQEYTIKGHKWFFSAPMCDAHLVTARLENTDLLGCFFVPRYKKDGTKNPIQIQRLKEKLGNKSNSSSEVEFLDAWGILIGEENRGIPTIIEMANYTRLSCVLGSTAIIRQATVQAIFYTKNRKAFGNTLFNQPLMRNVLVDFALESEASQHLAFKLSESFELTDQNINAKAWKRLVTPIAKFWICKRAELLTAEAMEVFGGNGYVEEGIMSRLFKEAPVNSIWEGSGNVMCLDFLRAIKKEPELASILLEELMLKAAENKVINLEIKNIIYLIKENQQTIEQRARLIAEKLIKVIQACLMIEKAPDFMSKAFLEIRFNQGFNNNFGSFNIDNINSSIDYEKILERTFKC